MELKDKKINFLGDSITQGCGVADPANFFTARIARMTGAATRNYGIGGTRIARKKLASAEPIWDQDYISRVDEMNPDADVIVVFGGTNDFGHGDAKIGAMSDRTPYTFYGALHTLIIDLYAKYPSAALVFITPLHRLSEDVTVNEIGLPLETNLEGFRNVILEVCRYYSIPVLDLWANSGMQPKIPQIQKQFMPDGLHPNDAGHAILAEKIVNFLKTI